MIITRPGPGWSWQGGAVYEHGSGVRIHVRGLCVVPGDPIIDQSLHRFVRMNGGNRKRGVMAWALNRCEAA